MVDADKKNKESQTKDGEERTKPKKEPPKEIGGRDGPDPVRYGDWENNGIASDF